jgi:hypothetical protein
MQQSYHHHLLVLSMLGEPVGLAPHQMEMVAMEQVILFHTVISSVLYMTSH